MLRVARTEDEGGQTVTRSFGERVECLNTIGVGELRVVVHLELWAAKRRHEAAGRAGLVDESGTLTFRHSCGHGVCGSDAMLINGRNRLACKVRIEQLGRRISVSPLPGLPVIKDPVVDMDVFFGIHRRIRPYFINDTPAPARERLQSPEERTRMDDTTKCILCAACTSSCPSYWAQRSYVGPAAIVNAHRFIFDSRDEPPTCAST